MNKNNAAAVAAGDVDAVDDVDDDDDDGDNILGTHLWKHVADIFHLISTRTLINTCARVKGLGNVTGTGETDRQRDRQREI